MSRHRLPRPDNSPPRSQVRRDQGTLPIGGKNGEAAPADGLYRPKMALVERQKTRCPQAMGRRDDREVAQPNIKVGVLLIAVLDQLVICHIGAVDLKPAVG